MRRGTRGAALAVALAASVLVVGCGGGGSGSSSVDSGGGFSSAAESACADAGRQITALGMPESSELLDYLEETDSIVAKLRVQIDKAGGGGSAEKAYVEGLARSVKILGEMVLAAQGQDAETVRALSGQLAELKLGKLAGDAGLEGCAKAVKIG